MVERQAKDVVIYESQLPAGMIMSDKVVTIEKGQEGNIQLLGKINVELSKGEYTSPFYVGPKANIYVSEEDIKGLNKYCHGMAQWQAPFFIALGANYLFPWNWPCFALDNFGGDEMEDVAYREATINKKLKDAAATLGGNAVVAVEIGGMSLINRQTGVTLSTSNAWIANGFVAYIKKQ